MKTEMRPVFITEDGLEFTDAKNAVSHERALKLYKLFEKSVLSIDEGQMAADFIAGNLEEFQKIIGPASDPDINLIQELVRLRVSIARIAQLLEVETGALPVTGRDYEGLRDLAASLRGWNELAGICYSRIENLKEAKNET